MHLLRDHPHITLRLLIRILKKEIRMSSTEKIVNLGFYNLDFWPSPFHPTTSVTPSNKKWPEIYRSLISIISPPAIKHDNKLTRNIWFMTLGASIYTSNVQFQMSKTFSKNLVGLQNSIFHTFLAPVIPSRAVIPNLCAAAH